MGLHFEALTGAQIAPVIADLAQLRIRVFRDWPYLYDGSAEYEARYLRVYQDNPHAIVVAARDGDTLVGAATGLPLQDADTEFQDAFRSADMQLSEVFYCAESVLLPAFRGQGAGHSFFDHREAHARALGLRKVCFCAVGRPADHPARPDDYRPLDPFWRARGYAPVPGICASFHWRDLGDSDESAKTLQFWMKHL